MDSAFLILVAIPLGIYVIVLLLNTSDLGEEEAPGEAAHLGEEFGSVLDEPIVADTVPAHEPQRAEAIPSDSGTIQDHPISSEVILAAEPVSGIVLDQTLIQTDSSDASTEMPAVADAALADEASRSQIAMPEDVTQALSHPVPETTSVSSDTIELTADAQSEPGGESQPVTSSSQIQAQEPEPDSAAETTAETASQPIVAEELESSPAVPKPLPETESLDPDEDDPILPEGPVVLPEKGSPKYAFDYRGRLWVEKKNKGFFRQLRRPQLPPEDPSNNSQR